MRHLLLPLLLLAACGGASTPEEKPSEKVKTEAKAPPAAPPATPSAPPAAPAAAAGDHGAHTPSAEFVQIGGPGKKVFFDGLADGAKVKSPLHLKFGAEGVLVKPAGDPTPNSGHNHILIDGKPIAAGEVVPKDEKNIHYGKGETEADITLTPGQHMLTLQLADHAHRSFGPPLSATITVTVE
jgi:hypothetical protein